MNMSIKQKTWSKLSSLTSLNLDQVLIPSQNTCLSSCMVTWLSHDITLPPRHGWLHSSSRLLPGLTLFLAIWSGVRLSRWWLQLPGVREGRHTRGGRPWVPYIRWERGRWYSPPDKDTAGEPVSRLVSLLQNIKQSKLNVVESSLFVVVKCSQVYWISPYTHEFTSQSTSHKTCTCIYMCICKNEKSVTTKKPMNYELITLATNKTLGSMWHDSPFQTVFGTSEEFIYRKKLDIMK